MQPHHGARWTRALAPLRRGRPFRACAYLVSGGLLGAAWLTLLGIAAIVAWALALAVVGMPLLAGLVLTGLPVAAVERRRLRLVDARPLADPHAAVEGGGLQRWLRVRLREASTWRELAHAGVFTLLLWPLDLIVVTACLAGPAFALAAPWLAPAARGADGDAGGVAWLRQWTPGSAAGTWWEFAGGLLAVVAAGYALTWFARLRALVTRSLLAPPRREPDQRVVELTRSRARLVDAFEVERRRIERDLHDGAQQRLVALTMTLGLARLSTGTEAEDLLRTAQDEVKLTLRELRELIRGIQPQLLTERGLPAAVAEVADRSPVPVDVGIDLPGRLPRQVESTGYFVVSEALANVVKHSGARRAAVEGRLRDETLTLVVRDDGSGGADASRGTGLVGLADRVAAIGGIMTLSSPLGGPTELRVEVPCPRPADCV